MMKLLIISVTYDPPQNRDTITHVILNTIYGVVLVLFSYPSLVRAHK